MKIPMKVKKSTANKTLEQRLTNQRIYLYRDLKTAVLTGSCYSMKSFVVRV